MSSSFFLWRRVEQENASVLFSQIMQPKGNPFRVVVVAFSDLRLLVLSAILFSQPSLRSSFVPVSCTVKMAARLFTRDVTIFD